MRHCEICGRRVDDFYFDLDDEILYCLDCARDMIGILKCEHCGYVNTMEEVGQIEVAHGVILSLCHNCKKIL